MSPAPRSSVEPSGYQVAMLAAVKTFPILSITRLTDSMAAFPSGTSTDVSAFSAVPNQRARGQLCVGDPWCCPRAHWDRGGRGLEDSPASPCTAGGTKSPFNGSQLSAAAPASAQPSPGIRIWHYRGYYAVITNHPLPPPSQHRQTITHANTRIPPTAL